MRSPKPRRRALRASALVIPSDSIAVPVVERQVQARRNRSNTAATTKGDDDGSSLSIARARALSLLWITPAAVCYRATAAAVVAATVCTRTATTVSVQSYCRSSSSYINLHTYCSYCRCADRCSTPAVVCYRATVAAVCTSTTANVGVQTAAAHLPQLLL
ncbi:hypothetical protein B296_00056992 [Ensete ventricosum]|uniref:Uncharacterized protein n=1 Tax=Ensete ventricosum TaxID=4639 RepID=A0A426XCC9_ENSVE|nr:hypothetical protein B296_00056992 [Ensete ventricosum]